jgi:transposase InsO family protein
VLRYLSERAVGHALDLVATEDARTVEANLVADVLGDQLVVAREDLHHNPVAAERAAVLAVLHEPRFVDLAPAEVYATLLDDRHAAPELLARRPKEPWSWDITKLLGSTKWTYFYLYVMLDVFSRYVVGWMVAHRESAGLAEQFIHETCERQGIEPPMYAVT